MASLALAGCNQTDGGAPPVVKQEPSVTAAPATPPPAPVAPAPAPEKITLKPPAGVENAVRVGVLLPLSGQHAALGSSLLDAIQLSLFEVAEENLVLLPRDTGGTADGARAAARDAIDSGAQFLLGPVFSDAAAAVADMTRDQGLALLAFTNNRAVAGPGTFIMGLLPEQRIRRVVSYAVQQGIRRFAGLFPAGAYGDLVRRHYEDAISQAGGEMVRIERYSDYQQDTLASAAKRLGDYDIRRSALLRQKRELEGKDDALSKRALARLEKVETLGEVGFDAVMLIESGRALTALAPLLPYYEIDTRTVRILGIDDWSARSLRREPALRGAWYAAPSPETTAEFAARFKQIFGRDPHPLAPLAYDGGALAAVMAARKPAPDFSADALTDPRGFAGSVGLFRFRKTGVAEHSFAVIEVRPEGVIMVSPPPDSFPPVLTN